MNVRGITGIINFYHGIVCLMAHTVISRAYRHRLLYTRVYVVIKFLLPQAQRDIGLSTSRLTQQVGLKKWPPPTHGRTLKPVESLLGNWY